MNFSEELKELGFHSYHIAILDSLEQGKKTAKQISKEKGIPMGRIYSFLSDLIEQKIVKFNLSTPSYYFIDNLELSLLNYLDKKLSEKVEKQNKIFEIIKTDTPIVKQIYSTEYFDTIINKERLNENVSFIKKIRRDSTYSWLFFSYDVVNSIPFRRFMYKLPKSIYSKKYIQKTRESCENQKKAYSTVPTRILMSEKSVDFFFKNLSEFENKKQAIARARKILKYLKKNKTLRINVSKEQFPFHLMITNSSFILAIKEEKEGKKNLVGTYIKGGKSIDKYSQIFDLKFKQATPLEKYADKLIKKIKTDRFDSF